MNWIFPLGVLLFLIGVLMLTNPITGITGFVISEEIEGNFNFIISLILIVFGMGLMIVGRPRIVEGTSLMDLLYE